MEQCPFSSSSSKSPVLVILPPTHACPDLKRILTLARKAFEDVSLHVLDLNLRFAWVSSDHVIREDDSETSTLALALHSNHTRQRSNSVTSESSNTSWATAPHSRSVSPVPGPVLPAVSKLDFATSIRLPSHNSQAAATQQQQQQQQSLVKPVVDGSPTNAQPYNLPNVSKRRHHRILLGNVLAAIPAMDLINTLVNPNVVLDAVTFAPARPLGPRKHSSCFVRSVQLGFEDENDANVCFASVVSLQRNGSLAPILPAGSAPMLSRASKRVKASRVKSRLCDSPADSSSGEKGNVNDCALPCGVGKGCVAPPLTTLVSPNQDAISPLVAVGSGNRRPVALGTDDHSSINPVPDGPDSTSPGPENVSYPPSPSTWPSRDPVPHRLLVSNFRASVTPAEILGKCVPRHIVLPFYHFYRPRALIQAMPNELVRAVKIGFACEQDRRCWWSWIRRQTQSPDGLVAKLLVPGARVHLVQLPIPRHFQSRPRLGVGSPSSGSDSSCDPASSQIRRRRTLAQAPGRHTF